MAYTPSTAKTYTLHIPDQALTDFNQLLKLTPLGPQTYENTQTTHNYGVTYSWLSSAKDHWQNEFSWRKQEEYINSFPNYTLEVEPGINIHFIGLFSKNKEAVPIMFMHGWPGSFIEFLPLIEKVKKKYPDPEAMPYHIIVPSLPGYTLSSGPPMDRDWDLGDTARVMNGLMKQLGFERYLAQGGDLGSFVATSLVTGFEECVGAHQNLFSDLTDLGHEQPDPESLSPLERRALDHAKSVAATGLGYAIEHGTRPSTIGFMLSTHPVALLAWTGEKFLEWSDPSTTPSLTEILTNVTLYWFTGSFPRSIWPYRIYFGATAGTQKPFPYIEKPFGFSMFPYELATGLEGVLKQKTNLVSYRQHTQGGHFAALEQPQELWDDVEEFVGKAWSTP
ncbi:epoxide hydrolase-like protein [Periconia macrospinosa]|uniref:Epoxide hydrolase-like protein n=1 Tax=Periconia macrospinosa TaxID=97972 RepID=A0A2V1DLU2_9PLEO|nr:epoxide hydrolase-like protein [Periconia macrospinosa]